MATLKSILVWTIKCVFIVEGLVIILLLIGLLLVAPVPQLVIHTRWCWHQLGLAGVILLGLGVVGIITIVIGIIRKQAVMHRTGLLLLFLPVIGVAIHRAISTADWGDISLLVAFLVSMSLIYFAGFAFTIDENYGKITTTPHG